MKRSKTVYAKPWHVKSLLNRLRDADHRECWAAIFTDADKTLQMSFERSTKCWAIMRGENPIGCFGVAPKSVLGSIGVPWLLATDELPKIYYNFLKQSKAHIAEMLEHFDMLENYVDVRNTKAVEWLKWCGFKMDEPKTYGLGRKPFRRFWMTKEDVCVAQ